MKIRGYSLDKVYRKVTCWRHFEVKVGNKAYWRNFDVLNSKMLVTKPDFSYQSHNLRETKWQSNYHFFQKGRLVCNIDVVDLGFSENKMFAEVGNKRLKHNFGVLNPKRFVTKLDFAF